MSKSVAVKARRKIIQAKLWKRLGREPTDEDFRDYAASQIDPEHPSNYDTDDDFKRGNTGFESMVTKIQLHENLARQVLRKNWHLKRRIEELENKNESIT